MTQADSKNSQVRLNPKTHQNNFPGHLEDDTLDLYIIWITLWKSKWLIIALTIVSAFASILYALQQEHVFKATALLLPPNMKDFQSINLIRIQETLSLNKNYKTITRLNSEDVFEKFKKNLYSRDIQKKFINEKGLIDILAPKRTPETRESEIYDGFSGLLSIGEIHGITSLSIEMNDPEIAAQWTNDLTKFVDKKTISMLVDDLQNSIENQIKEIKYNIRSKRLMAERRRQDQIVRYTEHAQIAKKIGMIGRVDATNIIQNPNLNVDIATTSTPLYYLGYEALMTQIEILRNRKSDDAFIIGLRDLQEQLALLRTIKFDKEMMRAVHIDQEAYPPKSAIKPNRRLIVSIITVVGFFLGIFVSLFIEFAKQQRKKHVE